MDAGKRVTGTNWETFWTRVGAPDADGCWPWYGTRARFGYGLYNGRQAHRLAFERMRGPIPDGLVLDHLCRHTWCVNPAHLEPVTNAENVRRQFAAQTECRNGHTYTPESTRFHAKTGRRVCRICKAAQQRRFVAKKRNEHGY